MNLLPTPRSLKKRPGTFLLPKQKPLAAIKITRAPSAVKHREGYELIISKNGVEIFYRETPGLRAASATLQQLLREYGRRLPCLHIRDWPDFPRRGVMLDISRGRVPKLETLLDFAEKLADLKINELQLYTEHTFAYRKYKSIWQSWGALTAKEIRILDRRCRELGIDLVPNQNSFGHLRYFIEDKRFKKLGEMSKPYEAETKDFIRRPTTLAPNHPGTLPFLRALYDEFLPNFLSDYFNVGCDETWDLGKGQSKILCAKKGNGRVYLEFLKKIHNEVSRRGRTMMFWGDIILKYPKLILELPKSGKASQPGNSASIALNWGYEADHPFAKETALFAKAKISFYVCPGTSTWQTLIGKHDNALANLRSAARAGKKSGAIGYLNTDWGDGGHPQPLAVSWPLFAAGAALAWNSQSLDEQVLCSVVNRDIFQDDSNQITQAAMKLGLAHKKLGVNEPNETPIGTALASARKQDRELFCRNGLKWFSKIPSAKLRAALTEIEKQLIILQKLKNSKPRVRISRSRAALKFDKNQSFILLEELELAARMAVESCKLMLWQQAIAAGKTKAAGQLAKAGIRNLEKVEKDYAKLWPRRNKATPKHSTPFLRWRIEDYRRGFVV